jgi:hypothetical protein
LVITRTGYVNRQAGNEHRQNGGDAFLATLIQQFATAIVRGMLERAKALSRLEQDLLKGELRELFVSEVLKCYLSYPFEIGSGIIINQRGDESNQTDIIIYDASVLPPFIKGQHLGVYPAECVLATVEVKSNLGPDELLSFEKAAKKLLEEVYSSDGSIYSNDQKFKPICTVFGFSGSGVKELKEQASGKAWLEKNCRHVTLIALAGVYSWVRLGHRGWVHESDGIAKGEEVKRFIAVLLDNVRSLSWRRFAELKQEKTENYASHRDWLSVYIREQEAIRKIFNKKNDDNDEPSPSLAAHEDPLHD